MPHFHCPTHVQIARLERLFAERKILTGKPFIQSIYNVCDMITVKARPDRRLVARTGCLQEAVEVSIDSRIWVFAHDRIPLFAGCYRNYSRSQL